MRRSASTPPWGKLVLHCPMGLMNLNRCSAAVPPQCEKLGLHCPQALMHLNRCGAPTPPWGKHVVYCPLGLMKLSRGGVRFVDNLVIFIIGSRTGLPPGPRSRTGG